MKINYFFPVFEEDNFEEYLTFFKSSDFFKKHNEYSFIFVCLENDKKNIDFILKESKKNKNILLLTLNNKFTYNDAFYYALNYFNGDVVLLGDTKIVRIDKIFEKCFEKYEKKASVVHVVKKHSRFKEFFYNLGAIFYNFFIKIYTGKKDRLNVVSLGLIDKNIMDLLKTLPSKCCFLKNTKELLGFETRTVYIPPKTQTYKLNFNKKTGALLSFILSIIVAICLIASLILLNCFIKSNLLVYNIVGILLIILSFSVSLTTLPKHIFDIRNFESKKEELELNEKYKGDN